MKAKITNYEKLKRLSPNAMANTLLNISEDMCIYCPRYREHRCNENCRGGLKEWLLSDYIPDSDVWKGREDR